MPARFESVSNHGLRPRNGDFEPGDTVAGYEVLDVLGTGGMGKVYKVRNVISGRIEAMKVLLTPASNRSLGDKSELTERFVREIRVHASLEHPNIAGVRTAQQTDGQILMILEFVEGETMESLLKRGTPPISEVVHYAVQVLDALEYAHAHSVIHRDIKPANIMVTSVGVVKLMDFGIAKAPQSRDITKTGRAVGSLYYMSPEQIQGARDVDCRSDLYQIGLWLYECVTGQRPFGGDSDYAIMISRLKDVAVSTSTLNPAVPRELSRVIAKALERNPASRFQSARAFKAALLNSIGWSTNEMLLTGASSGLYRISEWLPAAIAPDHGQAKLARLMWLNYVGLGFTVSMVLTTAAAAVWTLLHCLK